MSDVSPMKLKDVLLAVKQANLTKTQLEDYHAALTHMLSDLKIEEADLKRKRALFLVEKREGMTATDVKNLWGATEDGQRLLLLEGYRGAIRAELDSVKTRIYALL